MICVLACVEGESTEPNIVDGIVRFLRSQRPLDAYGKVEIVPLSLGGNHGHRALVERAIEKANEYLEEYEIMAPSDEIRKYLVVDYDKLDKHGVDFTQFRDDVISSGFIPIVTRPKIEYFIARLFYDEEDLIGLSVAKIDEKVEEGIKRFNEGKDAVCTIPPYSKQKPAAERCLQTIFNLDPAFLERARNIEAKSSGEYFTELPILIEEMCQVLEY